MPEWSRARKKNGMYIKLLSTSLAARVKSSQELIVCTGSERHAVLESYCLTEVNWEKDWGSDKILTHLEECEGDCNQEQTRACKAHSYQIQRKASQPGLVWEGKGTLVIWLKDNLFTPPPPAPPHKHYSGRKKRKWKRRGLSFEGLEKKAISRSHAARGPYWTITITAEVALLLNPWIKFWEKVRWIKLSNNNINNDTLSWNVNSILLFLKF